MKINEQTRKEVEQMKSELYISLSGNDIIALMQGNIISIKDKRKNPMILVSYGTALEEERS